MTGSITTIQRFKPSRRVNAETHAFKSGQAVRLKNAVFTSGNVYLITASLPAIGASPQYRIRNDGEKFERMASETDLELLIPSPRDKGDFAMEVLFGSSAVSYAN